MDHMGKMLCKYDFLERNLDVTPVHFDIEIFSRRWNPGEDLVSQPGKLFLLIGLHEVMHGPDPETFQRMISRGGGKDKEAVGIEASKLFCRFDSVCSRHVNIQKYDRKRPFFCSCKKAFSIFIFK